MIYLCVLRWWWNWGQERERWEGTGEIIMRNWDFREFRGRVSQPSPIQQVRVPIRRVIILIQGHPNPICRVIPLITHIHSYPPHRSHHHSPSLSFSSTTLLSSQNTKLSHPSLSCHVMSMSWHWVEHTPSTAYTEYSIHRVQHTLCTAYTQYSIHRVQHTPSTAYTVYSIHPVQHTPSTAHPEYCILPTVFVFPAFFDYKLTPQCSFSFRCASPWELKGKVTFSHSHGCELTNWGKESQHLVCRLSTASKYSSKLVWLRPASACSKLTRLRPPNSLDHGLQVYLQPLSIPASQWISKLVRSWPQSASPKLLDHGFQLHLQPRSIAASRCISKVARSPPPIGSPTSLECGLPVHFQTRSITASKCISKLPRSQPWSVFLNSADYGLQVHLQTRSITASNCISTHTWSRPRSVSLRSLDHHFQVHLELLKHRLQPVQIYHL